MAWKGLKLTVGGRNLLTDAQTGKNLKFLRLDIGDGEEPVNYNTRTELVHKLFSLEFISIEKTKEGCILIADLPKQSYDFWFREMAVIAKTDYEEVLYLYDNCGDDAEHVIATTGIEFKEKRIKLYLKFADVENITINTEGVLYITFNEFERGIKDIQNKLNESIEEWEIALSEEGWSSSKPYMQTIDVKKMKEDKKIIWGLKISDNLDEQSRKSMKKSYNFIDRIVSNDSSVTVYCYDKKPTVRLELHGKG